LLGLYGPGDQTAASVNLLDSHDTPRACMCSAGEPGALALALLLLFLLPGAPCLITATEMGSLVH